MKRFWRYWLSIVATASIATTATAQQDCPPTDIGSYQSILSRAGINQGYELGTQPRNGAVYGQGAIYGQAPAYNGQIMDQSGMTQGSVMQGQTNGRVMNGRAVQGNMTNGGVINGIDGGVVNGGVMNGRAVNGGVVNGGVVNGGVVNGGVSSGFIAAPSYGSVATPTPATTLAAPVYGSAGAITAPMYSSAMDVGAPSGYFEPAYFDSGMAVGRSINWVAGARALFFTRSGEAPIPLARNAAGGVLLSTVNDYGTMPGAEAVLTGRTCNNMGAELRYWGLYPNRTDVTFTGTGLDTYLIGLNDFLVAPGPTNVLAYFNGADNLRVYRNNEFHNLELNGLRNGGTYTTLRGRTGSYEMLGGFRWFQFNEDYRFAAFNSAVTPAQINYDLSTRNTLLGFQLGGRTETCLTDRLSFIGGTRVGLFNNRSVATQCIKTETGNLAYLVGSPTSIYDFESQRDNLAMLGELDMGVAFRFTERMRANIGYRLIGVNGVALAPNQIPRNFTNFGEINRIKSSDSLLLGGGYAGLEMCF